MGMLHGTGNFVLGLGQVATAPLIAGGQTLSNVVRTVGKAVPKVAGLDPEGVWDVAVDGAKRQGNILVGLPKRQLLGLATSADGVGEALGLVTADSKPARQSLPDWTNR